MIDGAIARKMVAVSKFGAKLDTVADFLFMFVCCVKIIPLIQIHIWLWVWIIIVALIKIFNIALVFIHKKKLISIHALSVEEMAAKYLRMLKQPIIQDLV